MVECPNCAFRNQESDGFCGSCGLYLWPEAYAGVAGTAGTADGAAVGAAARSSASEGAGRGATIPAGRRPEGPPAATAVQCRACGRPNAATRRFCGRCGNSLARATAYTAEPTPSAPVVAEPWWRRLMWWRRRRALAVFIAGTRPGRRPERSPRDPESALTKRAAPGRQAFGWLRRTLRRIWPDVFLILLILLLIALLFPDARRAVVNSFRDEPPPFLQPRFCQEPENQASLLAEFPPAFACDNKPETFWATGLGNPADPNDKVAQRRPRLWVDFAEPVDVHGFHITAGELTSAEFLSSDLLREAGRPAQICVKLYATPDARDQHYGLVLNRNKNTGSVQPLKGGQLQFPRPPEGKGDTSNCTALNAEGAEQIDDEPTEHQYAFAEPVPDVGAASIEIRRTHSADLDSEARSVYVSGLEFFGEVSAPADSDAGKEKADKEKEKKNAQAAGRTVPSLPETTRSPGGPA